MGCPAACNRPLSLLSEDHPGFRVARNDFEEPVLTVSPRPRSTRGVQLHYTQQLAGLQEREQPADNTTELPPLAPGDHGGRENGPEFFWKVLKRWQKYLFLNFRLTSTAIYFREKKPGSASAPLRSPLLLRELPQHERQNAPVAIIISLDRRIHACDHLEAPRLSILRHSNYHQRFAG